MTQHLLKRIVYVPLRLVAGVIIAHLIVLIIQLNMKPEIQYMKLSHSLKVIKLMFLKKLLQVKYAQILGDVEVI